MSLIPNRCVEYDEDRPICVASENRKKYTLNNSLGYKIKKVRVDGCILQQVGERRCDFLMHATKNDASKTIFIELKGGALVDALIQIYDTVIYLKEECKNSKFYARIVGTADVPNIESLPEYRKLLRLMDNPITGIKRATNRELTENIKKI